MAQPTSQGKCNKPAVPIGHGIYLCGQCQELILRDLQIVKRKAAEADRQMQQISKQAAGESKPPPYKLTHRGFVQEVNGGLPSLGKGQ